MTQTIEMIDPVTGELIDEKQIAERLLTQAKEQGVSLVGPGGLLGGLTKRVLETALEAEMTEHPRYEKHQISEGDNSRNGTRLKTVPTEVGAVQIEVPRDRDGSFESRIVRKRQRRLYGIDEIVLSLTARGLTTREVAAHFDDVYGASVSKETISKITDKVLAEIARELVGVMRRDMKTDWTVRAKLRSSIKRLLVKYKYPPDKQPEAIRLVIEQMESMAPQVLASSIAAIAGRSEL